MQHLSKNDLEGFIARDSGPDLLVVKTWGEFLSFLFFVYQKGAFASYCKYKPKKMVDELIETLSDEQHEIVIRASENENQELILSLLLFKNCDGKKHALKLINSSAGILTININQNQAS